MRRLPPFPSLLRRRRTPLPLLLALLPVLLLLAPAAQAEPSALGEVEASVLQLRGGGLAAGTLTVLHTPREGVGLDDVEGAPGVFTFTAERLLVGTDHKVSNVSVGNIASTPARGYADEASFGPVQVESARGGPHAYFFLIPLAGTEPPTVQAAGNLLSLAPAKNGLRQQEEHVRPEGQPLPEPLWPVVGPPAPDRPMLTTRSWDSIHVGGSPKQVVLHGDFAMTLWDWDLVVRDDGNVTEFKSGEEQTDTGVPRGPNGEQLVYHMHKRQVYLEAYGAELVLELQRPLDVALELSTLAATSQGFLEFQHAEGRLDGPAGTRAVAAPRLEVRGDVQAVLRGVQEDRMDVELRGERAEASIGAQSFVVSPTPDPWRWLPWAAGLLLLPVPLLFVARTLWIRSRHRAFEAAASEDRHDDALRLARPLLRSRRHGATTVVACTISLLKAGRPDEALRLLGDDARPIGEPGVRDYLLAHAYGLKDEWDQARTLLMRSLEQAPAIRSLVLQNRLLVHLLGDGQECDVA